LPRGDESPVAAWASSMMKKLGYNKSHEDMSIAPVAVRGYY
jgi:hypothetical protein